MKIKWEEVPGFGSRKGYKPEAVVIHVMEGSMEGTLQHFRRKDPADPVSSHYGVSLEGDIVQYVKEDNAAWANGRVDRPTANKVKEHPGVNPNQWTISIENEGSGKVDFTEAQYKTNAMLIADIARRYHFPINEDTVIPHRAIFAGKTCPGPVDMGKLIRLARAQLGTVPTFGTQVYSSYFKGNLTVVYYVSDKEWYFTVNAHPLASGIVRASSPFSAMQAAKP